MPNEAKRIFYQHKVETVQQAEQILKEVYETVRDTWTVLQEMGKISQKPGKRYRVWLGELKRLTRDMKKPWTRLVRQT